MRRRRIFVIIAAVLITLTLNAAAAANPDVILITLEGVRADRVGFLGAKTRTPNLDQLGRQSLIFEHAYAQAPLTVVSHATILSGTYPQTHEASELGDALSSTVPDLPSLFHSKGYRTAAFVSTARLDPRSGYAEGFARGFDTYDAGLRSASTLCHADQTVALATKWLTGGSKHPSFAWIQLCTSDTNNVGSYDRGVSALDTALGKVLTALRTAKLFDNSLVVVASDHGESLGAHGEDLHGIFLYDETIHVPLVIKLPENQLAGKGVKGHVRLLDVAPTMLEAAGFPVPSTMQGQSLLRIAKTNPNADQAVYSQSNFPHQGFGWSPLESWRAGKYLYIRAPKPELYDLTADPGATHNIAQSSKGTLDTIAAQLSSFDNHFGKGGQSSQAGLTSSEMQKLASLGYVGLQKSGSSDTVVQGIDPKDTIALANKAMGAMLDLDEGKPEEAIPALQQVVNSQPGMFLAAYGLGAALAKQQKYADAARYLHQAIELQPNSPMANYEMASVLAKTRDFKTAAIHAEIAAARMPKFAPAHSLLAQIYGQLGRKEDAARQPARP
jgi:arylsulfatase A-like enzyme